MSCYRRDGSIISSYKEDILISVVSVEALKLLEEPNTFLMYLAIIGLPATLVLLIGEEFFLRCKNMSSLFQFYFSAFQLSKLSRGSRVLDLILRGGHNMMLLH